MWKKFHKDIKGKLRFKHFCVNLFFGIPFFNNELIFLRPNLDHTATVDTNPPRKTTTPAPLKPAAPVIGLLSAVFLHPRRILMLWNWKSAFLSVILRAPIFFVAALRQGWRAMLSAVITESIFCAVSAGFYGSVVQSLKDAEPQWLTGIFLAVLLPLFFQGLEYLLHWFRGTPHLRVAAIVSLVVSAVSALFNWYAMRRGALLVGGEGGGFGGDLRRLPRLLFGFLAVLPRKLARYMKNRSLKLLTEPRGDLSLGS